MKSKTAFSHSSTGASDTSNAPLTLIQVFDSIIVAQDKTYECNGIDVELNRTSSMPRSSSSIMYSIDPRFSWG